MQGLNKCRSAAKTFLLLYNHMVMWNQPDFFLYASEVSREINRSLKSTSVKSTWSLKSTATKWRHCIAKNILMFTLHFIDVNLRLAFFMWLTSNHMFFSGDFGKNQPSVFNKILKSPSLCSGWFQNFVKNLGLIFPKSPSKTCDY